MEKRSMTALIGVLCVFAVLLSVSILMEVLPRSLPLGSAVPVLARLADGSYSPAASICSTEVVVMAMCKNEHRIMQEWLDHYRHEGVTHFYR